MAKRAILPGLAAGLAAGLGYWLAVRPWHLRWGLTEEEAAMTLPGDDLLPAARIRASHGLTIQAPAGRVWPWLVQLGQGRGGFYSYDWIENAMGLDIHTSNQILPQHQNLQAGDLVPLAPDGFGLPVALLEPEKYLVLHGDTRIPDGRGVPPLKPGEYLATVWSFHLFAQPDGSTRLVERWLADFTPTLLNEVLYKGFLELGAFIMERKMLLGIRERAEQPSLPDEHPE